MAPKINSLLCLALPALLSLQQQVGAFSYDLPSDRADIFKRAGPACDADNGTTFTDGAGDSYTVVCETNIGARAYIQQAAGASLTDCADQCSTYNQANNGGCVAAVLYQNACYLKADTAQSASTGAESILLIQAASSSSSSQVSTTSIS